MNTIQNFFQNITSRDIFNGGTLLLLWLIAINLIAFIGMGRDKRKARLGEWRTPEATLFLRAIIGGSIGSLLGMYVFHHKTRKPKFVIVMPLILILQILAVIVLAASSDGISFS